MNDESTKSSTEALIKCQDKVSQVTKQEVIDLLDTQLALLNNDEHQSYVRDAKSGFVGWSQSYADDARVFAESVEVQAEHTIRLCFKL